MRQKKAHPNPRSRVSSADIFGSPGSVFSAALFKIFQPSWFRAGHRNWFFANWFGFLLEAVA